MNLEKRRLGRSELLVSPICLGTMTWGEQNTESEAHRQLDYALDRGIDFLDTAEMYPVPPRGETQGRTEAYVGSWLAARRNRDRVVVATKVAGSARDISHLRDGNPRLDRKNIEAALEASLKRLRTDYVDLYQLHWPDRRTNTFGQLGYVPDPEDRAVPIEETLGVLDDLVRAGKVRHVGVSNETPWGLMRFLRLAEGGELPRVVSIQNAYHLLNRVFEIGLAEIAHREEVGLLAYSPLGGGTLSGKYLGGAKPAGARMTLFTRFTRYSTPGAVPATEKYVALARRHGLEPTQMALAFVHSRPFMASTIIGATTMEQLRSNIDAFELTLPADVLAGIEAIQRELPNPCP